MQEESWEKSACDHYCHLVMHCDAISVSEIVQNSSCHQRDGNEAKAFIVRSFEGMETNLTSRSSHIMNTYFHIRAPPFSALCHLQFLRFVFHFSSHLFLSRRIWIHCGSQGLHSPWNMFVLACVFFAFLRHFWFWMGIVKVARWIRLEILNPNHMQESKIGLLEQI